MTPHEKKDVERELEARRSEERRQWSGSTPTEDVLERALDTEPGAARDEDDDPNVVPHPGGSPT